MSQKDFQHWHRKKADIDGILQRPFFQESEIWFCHLGINVGFEQDGHGKDFLRPIVILKKFNNEVFWAVPLTKVLNGKKRTSRYFYCFSFMHGMESAAILSQIRLLDARRLAWKIGTVSDKVFDEIKERLKDLFP